MVDAMRTLKTARVYPMRLAGFLCALALLLAAPALLFPGQAQAARDFRLVDSTGKVHTLAGYKGKWVLVNYWATWCPPCLEEIPDLIALHENPKNKLVVLGIALDWKSKKQVLDFADGLFVNYPIILGDRKLTRQIGPADGLPMTYLFNPEGKLVAQQAGAITRQAVESFIHAKPKK